eukprot:14662076-Alexandrium_andersonii.AAC.1
MRARLAWPRWWRGFTIHRTFHEATRTCAPPPAGRRRQARTKSRRATARVSSSHVKTRGGSPG